MREIKVGDRVFWWFGYTRQKRAYARVLEVRGNKIVIAAEVDGTKSVVNKSQVNLVS